MDYKEYYEIRYKWFDSFAGITKEGTLGPYPCEEDAMSMMKKIQNRHDHVKNIYRAHLYRVSEVDLAGYARARD